MDFRQTGRHMRPPPPPAFLDATFCAAALLRTALYMCYSKPICLLCLGGQDWTPTCSLTPPVSRLHPSSSLAPTSFPPLTLLLHLPPVKVGLEQNKDRHLWLCWDRQGRDWDGTGKVALPITPSLYGCYPYLCLSPAASHTSLLLS